MPIKATIELILDIEEEGEKVSFPEDNAAPRGIERFVAAIK